MSSEIRIFKQDVIKFLTQNLNEENIEEYLKEFTGYTNLIISKETIQKGYKM
jgi:hypothetical protein